MSAEIPPEKCLLSLDEVPMNKILGKLEFPAVQKLRKTCSSLRIFIDNNKPDSALTKLNIRIAPDYISPYYFFDDTSLAIKYCRKPEGCLVEWYGQDYQPREKLLESENFFDVAARDIFSVLKNQKSVLGELNVECYFDETPEEEERLSYEVADQFLKQIKSLLASKPQKLRVKTFEPNEHVELQMLHLLPQLEIENMTVRNTRRYESITPALDMEDLVKSEQWKKLDTLNIIDFHVNLKIRDLVYLKRCYVTLETMDGEMFEELKQAFQTSSHLEYFKIGYNESDAQNLINPNYAGPYSITNQLGYVNRLWFFSVSTPERVLSISISSYWTVFNFDWLVNVPQGVVVN